MTIFQYSSLTHLFITCLSFYFFFLLCHQKHFHSVCVFAQVVCSGVSVRLLKGSQSCTVPACVCVVLPVLSFCAVAGQVPVVSVEPRAATVRQGESVSFRCQVGSGAQPIQLEWKKANNQALPGQE